MRARVAAGALFLLAVSARTPATPTEVMPLSGMGKVGEAPVYWDFQLDRGRGSGEWRKIAVPSQWEQQGFGTYYYGTQGRGKPDDDPVIPQETARYKRTFEVPPAWRDRDIVLIFEAAMTDTTVTVNGKSAGPTHQGGFYRFSFDITSLVKPGSNEIEVTVAKESANTSVNRAERRGDYWTFGGIYRPVWIEARPRHHIAWTAIDARADGSFTAHVYLDEPAPRRSRVQAQIVDDPKRKPLPQIFHAEATGKNEVIIRGKIESPATWTAETPHLYWVRFELKQGSTTLHRSDDRFGFRTVEVRENDGVYLNGSKIVLKGVNRHSFRPATGRTLSREENYADARLIKSMNMNAVRMSHYPPDTAFLEAADELGLYVLDELAGWQGTYDTPTGARLIGQIVRRDVNHPSILFWDNGNEGGWNTENDGEFARWDPQARKVLHPWAIHDGINTDHYENYESTKKLSAGPQIFMPTEFLHGLYDGGIGAGFEDYWRVMGSSPTVAGGFFGVFADEGIERTDQGRRIDNVGNQAPDGIVGPHHEKEGSFFTVKEIWSPVQVSQLALENGHLRLSLRNAYDFTSLDRCEFRWRVVQPPSAGSEGAAELLAHGEIAGPALAPRESKTWEVPVPAELEPGRLLELSAHAPDGAELWTWVLACPEAPRTPRATRTTIRRDGERVVAGEYELQFDEGKLTHIGRRGVTFPLSGPVAAAWLRHERTFVPAGSGDTLVSWELAPRNAPGVIARARYTGTLRSLVWRLEGDEVRVEYELAGTGDVDIFGVKFDFPAEQVQSRRWLGAGPYRVWKNRLRGTTFGLHDTAFNDPVPGESYAYPEFAGFFGDWRWLEMKTGAGKVIVRNVSGIPYFGQHRPQPGKQPVLDVPDQGWSFLHAIPAIGTKFTLADVLGPQSRPTTLDGTIRGEIALQLVP